MSVFVEQQFVLWQWKLSKTGYDAQLLIFQKYLPFLKVRVSGSLSPQRSALSRWLRRYFDQRLKFANQKLNSGVWIYFAPWVNSLVVAISLKWNDFSTKVFFLPQPNQKTRFWCQSSEPPSTLTSSLQVTDSMLQICCTSLTRIKHCQGT